MLYCSSCSRCRPYPCPSCCSQPYLASPSRCCASCLHIQDVRGWQVMGKCAPDHWRNPSPIYLPCPAFAEQQGAASWSPCLMFPSGSWRCGSIHMMPSSSDCDRRMRMPAVQGQCSVQGQSLSRWGACWSVQATTAHQRRGSIS